MMVKRLAKRLLQHAVSLSGPHRWTSRKGRLLVLMYHRILPESHPDCRWEQPGMVVQPDTFALHLKLIKRYFEPVMLSDWIAGMRSGQRLPDKACAITFDDGWADNYEHGYDRLRSEQLPASVFLVSGMIGTDKRFWPERLGGMLFETDAEAWHRVDGRWLLELGAHWLGRRRPTRDEVDGVINRAKRHPDPELHRRIDETMTALGWHERPGDPHMLTWEQVREMRGSGLIEFGSHTCSHRRLTADVPHAELEREVLGSKATVERHTEAAVSLFCYPNGDYCAAAEDLVREHYAGALTTRSGWNPAGADPYRLQRIGIHQDVSFDAPAFLSRLSAWL